MMMKIYLHHDSGKMATWTLAVRRAWNGLRVLVWKTNMLYTIDILQIGLAVTVTGTTPASIDVSRTLDQFLGSIFISEVFEPVPISSIVVEMILDRVDMHG